MLAEVIVDRAVWGLNRELTYAVPAELADRIRVGSIVRVTLRNRRVRGWVVGLDANASPGDGISPVAAVSGRGPVFDEPLLGMARSLSRRYVHPLSSFLSLFTPPRVGRRGPLWEPAPLSPAGPDGRRVLWRLRAGEDPLERYSQLIRTALQQGAGAIVAVPEVREGSRVLGRLAQRFPGEAAVVHSGLDPAERSRALWEVASGRRRLVLGGRGALFAPAMPLGLIVVHQEHDPSFKQQQAPYYDARVAAEERARATGALLVLASATPAVDRPYWSAGGGWEIVEDARLQERAAWPAIEVVAPPRQGLPQRAVACLLEARRRGERSIILLPRVQATPSGPGPEELVALVARVVPGASVARADRPALGAAPGALQPALTADVVVATEAALAEVERPEVSVAVALGVDGYFARPRGRAAEDAAGALWALAGLVAGRRPRGRVVVEAASDNHAIEALVRGDYRYFVRRELEQRRLAEAPPFRSLIRLQTSAPTPELLEALKGLKDTRVLGPVPGGSLGYEILLKSVDPVPIIDALGTIVSTGSTRVLVEVDPKDW